MKSAICNYCRYRKILLKKYPCAFCASHTFSDIVFNRFEYLKWHQQVIDKLKYVIRRQPHEQ